MSEFLNNWDLLHGVGEVVVDSAKRFVVGAVHLATQHIQHETPSNHHFEHPVEPIPNRWTDMGEYFDGDAA